MPRHLEISNEIPKPGAVWRFGGSMVPLIVATCQGGREGTVGQRDGPTQPQEAPGAAGAQAAECAAAYVSSSQMLAEAGC